MLMTSMHVHAANLMLWLAQHMEEHGEEASGGGNPFIPNYASFWTWGIFLILVALMYKFAWPGILKALDERETKIRESLEAAAKAQAESQRIFEEHKRLVLEAREEAQKIVAAGREAGEALKTKLVEDAKAESDAMVARAKKEISMAEEKAVAEVRTAAVNLSLDAAGRIIGRVLDPATHAKLAQECIAEVEKLGRN